MKPLSLALIFTVLAFPTFAQNNCANRDKLVTVLKEKYDEVVVAVGVRSPTSIVEIFAAPSGSFSVVSSRVDGVSCIISSGQNFQFVDSIEDEGDPT